MNLGKYIYELLQSHECVVIPSLGGFITRKEGATLHSIQNLFTPPTRSVIFNEQLVHNDGLLAHYIAEKESIEYEVALRSLMFEINENLFSLYKGKTVELTQIGTLSIKNERIHFEANTGLNVQDETYGLTSFMMPLVQRERKIQPKPVEPVFVDETTHNRHIGRYIGIAASIVVLLGCFSYFLIFQPRSDFNLSSFCPEIKSWFMSEDNEQQIDAKVVEKETTKTEPEILQEQKSELETSVEEVENQALSESSAEDLLKIEPEKEIIETSEPEPIAEKPTLIEKPVVGTKKYHVIGASYEVRKNAEIRCAKVKDLGFEADVLDAPNFERFRVSYGCFSSREEAEILLDEVRKTYRPDAWLLVVK